MLQKLVLQQLEVRLFLRLCGSIKHYSVHRHIAKYRVHQLAVGSTIAELLDLLNVQL